MTSPILIHIGLHKTGTTWLQQSIFSRTGLGFTRVWPRTVIDDAFIGGNPYAFDGDRALALLAPFMTEARATQTVPVISHEPLSGRLILNGFDSKTIADRVRTTLPDASILIVVREQRAMMLSVYKQYVRTFGTLPISRLWREYAPEERRNPTPGLEVFEYHRLIGYYQQLFGKDKVLVLPFELLREDARAFVGRIASFVGLPTPSDVPGEAANVSVPGALVAVLRWRNRMLRAFGILGPFGGPISDEGLRSRVYRATDRLGGSLPPGLSRPFDRRLRAKIDVLADGRFAQSNVETARLTGLDLSSYGYDVPPG